MIPTLKISTEQTEARQLSPETLEEAAKLFRDNGFLLLQNAFSPAFISGLHDAYLARYREYLRDKEHEDALTIGDKRFMITVSVEPPFNDPELYANPFVLSIIQILLGDKCVLGGLGSVAALPGSEQQHVHRDASLLFGGTIDALLPAYAVTAIIPLVELNETNGTTRMWKGTHRTNSGDISNRPHQDPLVSLGSCLLMDYRLIHSGTPNVSQNVRPILSAIYNRPWFRDYQNYSRQRALQMSREEFEKIPEKHRALFASVEFI